MSSDDAVVASGFLLRMPNISDHTYNFVISESPSGHLIVVPTAENVKYRAPLSTLSDLYETLSSEWLAFPERRIPVNILADGRVVYAQG